MYNGIEKIIALRVIGSAVFSGVDVDEMSDLWDTFIKSSMTFFIAATFVPKQLIRFVPIPAIQSFFRCGAEIDKRLKEAALKAEANAKSDISPTNMLERMAQQGVSVDLMVDEAKTFLFAGQDTTSSLLSWAVSILYFFYLKEMLKKRKIIRPYILERKK